MLIILGPTATGKTRLAAQVAAYMDGEIISADSRQVFRGMDLGTGKDLLDYTVAGKAIPYHLIDIAEPGEEYSVYRFQSDFIQAYKDIISRSKFPILCGGTGLYIESVVKGYRMISVPENTTLRKQLEEHDMEALTKMLSEYRKPHSTTDTCNRERILRAIEIESYQQDHPEVMAKMPAIVSTIVGIHLEREEIRKRITDRLQNRLDAGMIGEVELLIKNGVNPERLMNYGLEYKFLTAHILGRLSREEMFTQLNIAIHQFAKRQMTWFRHMEKNGSQIHWIDGHLPDAEKIQVILELLKESDQGGKLRR